MEVRCKSWSFFRVAQKTDQKALFDHLSYADPVLGMLPQLLG